MPIKLGDKVRDMITGFTGIASARSEWLYGCTRVLIQPQELKDGKPVEDVWFDEQRVELVEAKDRPMSPHSTATNGGPRNDPRPPGDPSR